MEQVALPGEGPERQLVEALLTAAGKPRAPIAAAKLSKQLPELGAEVPGLLQALAARGLVITSEDKRGAAVYAASPSAAAAIKGASAKPRPARAAKAQAATVPEVQALLRELEGRLLERIAAQVTAAVREALGAAPATAPAAPGASSAEPLEASIPPAIREADQRGHHGGLVPIPEVRRLVLERSGATRAQFDAALIALERGFHVDLKIANDARRPDASEGIEIPGRGLLYFALAR